LLGLNTLLVTAIIGTNSRGGLIALLAVGGYLFIKSKRKFLFAFLVLAIGSLMIGLVSEEWFTRMGTIDNAEGDNSFMGRVVSWKLSYIMAMQHPIFGGGFGALTYTPIWRELCQSFDLYPWFILGLRIQIQIILWLPTVFISGTWRPWFYRSVYFPVDVITGFLKAGSIASKIKNQRAGLD